MIQYGGSGFHWGYTLPTIFTNLSTPVVVPLQSTHRDLVFGMTPKTANKVHVCLCMYCMHVPASSYSKQQRVPWIGIEIGA